MAACNLKRRLVPGAIALYTFEEGAGQYLYDRSGNGNHGTLGSTTGSDTNDPTWTTQGLYGITDDYISLPDTPVSTGFTVLTVCKIDPASTYIICQYDSDINQRSWAIRSDITSKLTVWLSTNGTTADKQYTSSVTCNNGANYYLVGFRFNAGALDLIVNGVVDPNPTKTSDNACATLHNSTAAATLFCRLGNGTPANFASGTIAFSSIYQRLLTATEIAQNYNFLKSYLAPRGISL